MPLDVDGRFGTEGKAKLDDGERPAKDLPAKKPADSAGHAYRVDSPAVGDETDTDTWNRKYVPPVGRTTVETLLSGEMTPSRHSIFQELGYDITPLWKGNIFIISLSGLIND